MKLACKIRHAINVVLNCICKTGAFAREEVNGVLLLYFVGVGRLIAVGTSFPVLIRPDVSFTFSAAQPSTLSHSKLLL